ncbi:ATP-dependent permease MDL1 [Eremomyces bilateralis CBS 781.70]|uniref:ATP-dependent permease MDL1 n=1 Tax=Eremomyces bilateralis CBS 781.70 TaxID=1392243 RepID=A0A6G1GF92_9PEZI|nr:ATP-dependent permease MDL1 [Eremomyces bilateralis CBS 781.70]KAF1816738.1 ATP-dependent permease MDL1 [Eremomyces bilateralis CBS 781.70]
MSSPSHIFTRRIWHQAAQGAQSAKSPVQSLLSARGGKNVAYTFAIPSARCLGTLTLSSTRTLLHRVPRSFPSAVSDCKAAAGSSKRVFATSRALQAAKKEVSYRDEIKHRNKDEDDVEEDENDFKRSEKASQASQINLRARLSKEGSKNRGMSEIWRLIMIAIPERKMLGVAVLCLFVSSGVTMSIPFAIGKILDIANKDPEGKADFLMGLDPTTFYLGLAAIFSVGAAANFGRVILLRKVGERIVARLRTQLFRKTMTQDAEFFDANRVGDLISRLSSDTIIVGKSVTQNLSDGLRAVVSGAAGFSLMAYVSLDLTLYFLYLFPIIGGGAFFFGRFIRNISRKLQKGVGTLTKIAEERLGSVRTSQAFAGEVQEVSRYNKQVRKIYDLGVREAKWSAAFFGGTGFAGNITILYILFRGSGMVQGGDISIGELSSFLMYTAYAGSSMYGLSGFFGELMKGVGAATRLFELQDRTPPSPTKGARVLSARGDIAFNSVSFSYPTRPAVSIFQNLSFRVEQGTNVAIVAPSGAGKSTVASLLMRFYVPGSGSITIDGKDIGEMNAKQLRRKIGYVGQEPVLFSGSVAENISYGRPWATRSEIIQAARKANCGFISDFPEGLETHVGARGTQLSGGQKQRIAIARALLKDPDILILDEATSALDAESETLVNQALHTLLREKNTTISIAHRLSTIKRSDRIICIGADGTVAEEGTYEELTTRDGAFTRLMEWQMQGGDALMKRGENRGEEKSEEEAKKAEPSEVPARPR